jgi:hypothetical protein
MAPLNFTTSGCIFYPCLTGRGVEVHGRRPPIDTHDIGLVHKVINAYSSGADIDLGYYSTNGWLVFSVACEPAVFPISGFIRARTVTVRELFFPSAIEEMLASEGAAPAGLAQPFWGVKLTEVVLRWSQDDVVKAHIPASVESLYIEISRGGGAILADQAVLDAIQNAVAFTRMAFAGILDATVESRKQIFQALSNAS